MPELERNVQRALLPNDEADAKNAILEIRAGTGGDEATLFAADLFRMYQRYAENRGWKVEVMDASCIGRFDGVAKTVLEVAGGRSFRLMWF